MKRRILRTKARAPKSKTPNTPVSSKPVSYRTVTVRYNGTKTFTTLTRLDDDPEVMLADVLTQLTHKGKQVTQATMFHDSKTYSYTLIP